jgi:uncharacterized protein YuzE
MKTIDYDKEYDILFLHKGFAKDEKFGTNIDIGDFILDVSTKKRIVGIEIHDASKFFKDFNIEKSVLNNIVDANFHAQTRVNAIMISMTLKAKEKENIAKIRVPLTSAISI